MTTYHIDPKGSDQSIGSKDEPFRTISKAAALATAGDTIIVHEGVYREWVNPTNGGTSDDNRIIYQAADNACVIISGAEPVTEWESIDQTVFKTVIPNHFFGEFNPFQERLSGDWFFDQGRSHHLGEVYIDGRAMIEAETLDVVLHPKESDNIQDIEWSKFVWYAECTPYQTNIWANFHDYDPSQHLIEINVRPHCFWPTETGRNYITVSGFTLRQAATQWAPPTALQEGLIGPHWSKGWIIQNNIISDSKSSGISLGKDMTTGHNEWSRHHQKHGAQTQRESIFLALHMGWNKETIGSHIVRNNTIYNCGQTGICGNLGAVFSQIYSNHIYNIYTHRNYYGFEIAGIKLHAAIDTLIENNHIHNTFGGIWLDWQAQGTRVSRNLIYDNSYYDFFVEVSHGPYMVDNNIMLSDMNVLDASQGGAYIHNLFAGYFEKREVLERYTPYHFPHSTAIMGLMTIIGGDNRFFNNIFTAQHTTFHASGLHIYQEWPSGDEYSTDQCRSPASYARNKLPIYSTHNVYYNTALPHHGELDPHMNTNHNPNIQLNKVEHTIQLAADWGTSLSAIEVETVYASSLVNTYQTHSGYNQSNEKPMNLDIDFFGNQREGPFTTPGPFQSYSSHTSVKSLPLDK